MAAQQLHASFPKSFFPGFFPNTWQLPDLLSSAPILKRLLLLLYTHTHTHTCTSLSGKGERGCMTFPSVLCPPGFAQEHGGSFTFSSAILSLVHLGKKPYCHLQIFFPCVFHLLVREFFPTLLCSSSSVAVFVSQRGQWQNVTPSSWLLSLQGFHSCCAAHWGFQLAHSQVARHNWCEK